MQQYEARNPDRNNRGRVLFGGVGRIYVVQYPLAQLNFSASAQTTNSGTETICTLVFYTVGDCMYSTITHIVTQQ